jgi:Asp-tRNA(Asn)/Glu-tRNA(Gln) amidotransferase A subunit family amidase
VSDDVVHLSAARQAMLIRERKLSPVEAVRAYLERIDRSTGACTPTSP